VPVVEAALLKRLMGSTLEAALPMLTNEELDLLKNISKRVLEQQGKQRISDVVDRQGKDSSKQEGLPASVEMLTILARYETSRLNDIIKTVNLIHHLQARRVAAEGEARIVNATPSTRQIPLQSCSSSSPSPLSQK
jgi:hypothetical protein